MNNYKKKFRIFFSALFILVIVIVTLSKTSCINLSVYPIFYIIFAANNVIYNYVFHK
jgi:hypothetical protein